MNPMDLILWASFAGMAWFLVASFTGADEWLKSLFGNSKLNDLEKRVMEMEVRMETMEKK
jgi:hypothetical protein